jgi:hypothetical protein
MHFKKQNTHSIAKDRFHFIKLPSTYTRRVMQVLDVLVDTYMLGTGQCELGGCPGELPLCLMMRCISLVGQVKISERVAKWASSTAHRIMVFMTCTNVDFLDPRRPVHCGLQGDSEKA